MRCVEGRIISRKIGHPRAVHYGTAQLQSLPRVMPFHCAKTAPDQRVIATTLADLELTISNANLTGPALTFLGLAPRGAVQAAQSHDLRLEAL